MRSPDGLMLWTFFSYSIICHYMIYFWCFTNLFSNKLTRMSNLVLFQGTSLRESFATLVTLESFSYFFVFWKKNILWKKKYYFVRSSHDCFIKTTTYRNELICVALMNVYFWVFSRKHHRVLSHSLQNLIRNKDMKIKLCNTCTFREKKPTAEMCSILVICNVSFSYKFLPTNITLVCFIIWKKAYFFKFLNFWFYCPGNDSQIFDTLRTWFRKLSSANIARISFSNRFVI